MTAEAWPTEAAATKAVDAAARKAYEMNVAQRREVFPPSATFPDWDDLPPLEKLPIRQAVLPIVWAALSDLPDPRYGAWAEGHAAGYSDGGFDSAGFGAHEYAENPYPSGI